ncbi:MAG: hypothetical protein AB1Z23_11815 [Eubacteriales bacterium]
MNKSSIKIGLFVCVACSLLVGASLFFSLSTSTSFISHKSNLTTSGDKISEQSDFYEYTGSNNLSNKISKPDLGDAFAIFEYENIDFVSYSEQWDSTKLEELAHEFFLNVHGEEIAYVARIELIDGKEDEYAGLHRNSYEKFSVPVAVNQLLPESLTLDISELSSVIELTGADQNTTVASMARTLSHEYGHHYTQYHFGFKGTNEDSSTKYASIRKDDKNSGKITYTVSNWEYYIQNHMWDLQEIAAEDYVFLMGSPLAKQRIDYLDNQELADLFSLNQTKYNEEVSLTTASINSYPHENPVLKSPSQVKGLAEYFYSFVEQNAPQYTSVSNVDELTMNISPTGTGSYTMTWSIPWPYSNITYTLVAYDANDYLIRPIKTITGDEAGVAYFGMQKVLRNQNEYTIDDTLDELGFVRFRVVVIFSDGSAVFSNAYDVQY